jgi:hypothetical protein
LHLFPCHRQPSSQVPYESPDEIHAACTPDTAWLVRRFPPCSSQGRDTPRFRCHLRNFDTSSAARFHSSLSSIQDVVKATPFTETFTTAAFDRSKLPAVWNLPLQGGSEGPTFISRAAWCFRAFLTQCPRFLSPSTPAPPAFPPSSRHWRPPRHLLEMHRRCLTDEKARRQFQLLGRRLRAVADQLAHITTPENEERLARHSRISASR